ncbi:hypothetical protein Esti_002628 [Eimeria stiedai]
MRETNVRVVVRTRPTRRASPELFTVDEENDSINIRLPQRQDVFQFRFDRILHECSQEAIFEECMPRLIDAALEGFNATAMAYGQVGSLGGILSLCLSPSSQQGAATPSLSLVVARAHKKGAKKLARTDTETRKQTHGERLNGTGTGAGKTYTMCGDLGSYELRGLIPRSLALLFEQMEKLPETEFKVSVSYCEIYSELILDLLAEGRFDAQTGADLQIREDSKGGLFVRGLTVHPCETLEEALNCFFLGSPSRSVSSHVINVQSSRSHCIFSIYVESRQPAYAGESTLSSKLHLVDLAGCERSKKTQSEGSILRESAFINKSLSFLEMVVVALGEKGREHIPYRSTRLTHLLKDTIGGNSKTCFIANIWPAKEFLEETVSTLRFSLRMMRVANRAVVNMQVDPLALAKKYQREIVRLKQELQMQSAVLGRPQISYEASTPEELEKMRKEATQFLNGEQETIPFTSVRQVEELLQVIRSIFQEASAAAKREAPESASAALSVPDSETSSATQVGNQGGPQGGPLGGPLDAKSRSSGQPPKSPKELTKTNFQGASQGSPQGAAQTATKPLQYVGYDDPSVGGRSLGIDPDQSEIHFPELKKETRLSTTSEPRPRRLSAAGSSAPLSVDKPRAFKEFMASAGSDFDSAFTETKRKHHQQKTQLKTLCKEILECRERLSCLRDTLKSKKEKQQNAEADEPGGPRVVDEEEFLLLKEMRELKATARSKFALYGDLREAASQTEASLSSLRVRLVAAFNTWYDRNYALDSLDSMAPRASILKGPAAAAVAAFAEPAAASARNTVSRLLFVLPNQST